MRKQKDNKMLVLKRHPKQKAVKDGKALKEILKSEGEKTNWGLDRHNMPLVWEHWLQTEGEDVKVAVLDTGIDTDHPDLKDAIEDTEYFIGNSVEDGFGHGTYCSGIIAARQNEVGYIGVAPKSKLLIAKVVDDDGTSDPDILAEGINWAVEKGAHILSISLGYEYSTPDLYYAIHNALAYNVMVVCAAGNEGSIYKNSIGYPARYGSTITIGAHDMDGNPSGFSSRGGEIDLLAPGMELWSSFKDGGYIKESGTSVATPFVAGISALILAKHMHSDSNNTPLINNDDLREHLLWMTTHPGYHDNQSGYGPLQPLQMFLNQL